MSSKSTTGITAIDHQEVELIAANCGLTADEIAYKWDSVELMWTAVKWDATGFVKFAEFYPETSGWVEVV